MNQGKEVDVIAKFRARYEASMRSKQMKKPAQYHKPHEEEDGGGGGRGAAQEDRKKGKENKQGALRQRLPLRTLDGGDQAPSLSLSDGEEEVSASVTPTSVESAASSRDLIRSLVRATEAEADESPPPPPSESDVEDSDEADSGKRDANQDRGSVHRLSGSHSESETDPNAPIGLMHIPLPRRFAPGDARVAAVRAASTTAMSQAAKVLRSVQRQSAGRRSRRDRGNRRMSQDGQASVTSGERSPPQGPEPRRASVDVEIKGASPPTEKQNHSPRSSGITLPTNTKGSIVSDAVRLAVQREVLRLEEHYAEEVDRVKKAGEVQVSKIMEESEKR